MNKKVGRYGALLTGASVVVFAISMIFSLIKENSGSFVSYFSCIFLAIGYIVFACSLYSVNRDDDKKALGIIGLSFGIIYSVIIFIVYYAQCTTVNLNSNLSSETLSIIDYSKLGSLFFNYDLLGYGFMALSTFFISFTINTNNKSSILLKKLLLIHGIFFISCFIMPMFPIFTTSTDNLIGTVLLEIWCMYFLPICILGYKYFDSDK